MVVPGAGATPLIALHPEEPTRILHDELVGLQGGSPATFIDLPLSGAVIECGVSRPQPVGYTLSVENERDLRSSCRVA